MSGKHTAAGVLALLLLAARGTGAPAALSPADYEIRFWEARLPVDPFDATAPTRLGMAYLQKAREGGEFALYLKADEVLRQALDRRPDHYPALASLAAARAAQHRFREGIALAKRAIEVQPEEPYAYGILGDALLEVGELRRADAVYARLKRLEGGFLGQARLAGLLAARGDVNGAVAGLERAVRSARQSGAPAESLAWCRVQIGSLRFEAGRWAEAERQYRMARSVFPGYLPLEHLAELRAAQGRPAEALELYRQVLDLAPHPEFYHAMGEVYAGSGRAAEARRCRLQALEGYLRGVRQGNRGYYRHLAMFHADVLKQPAEAVRWALRDLEVRQDGATHATLAWACHRAGQTERAILHLRRAMAKGIRSAESYYQAGVVLRAAGRRAEARSALLRSLRINPRAGTAEKSRGLLHRRQR